MTLPPAARTVLARAPVKPDPAAVVDQFDPFVRISTSLTRPSKKSPTRVFATPTDGTYGVLRRAATRAVVNGEKCPRSVPGARVTASRAPDRLAINTRPRPRPRAAGSSSRLISHRPATPRPIVTSPRSSGSA